MTYLPILFSAGLLLLSVGCGKEVQGPGASSQSVDLKPLEKRVDLLQKRQQEDRDLLIAQIAELQGTVSRLENRLEGLAQREAEVSPASVARIENPDSSEDTSTPGSTELKRAPDEATSLPEPAPRIRVRGSTSTLKDDYLDPPTGPNPDWFPLSVGDISLVRKETGHRVMTRVEKTGEMVKDENGQLREEEVRLQEKVPTYAYEVSATLKSRLKKAQDVRVSAGGKSVTVKVGPGGTQTMTLPATPNAPLVVESGRWSRSFPVTH